MAMVLVVAIAYICACSQGKRLKQQALQKYIARPERAERSQKRHRKLHVGLAAYRWIPF